MLIPHIVLLATDSADLQPLGEAYARLQQTQMTASDPALLSDCSGDVACSETADVIILMHRGDDVVSVLARLREQCCAWQPILLISEQTLEADAMVQWGVMDCLPHFVLTDAERGMCRMVDAALLRYLHREQSLIQMANQTLLDSTLNLTRSAQASAEAILLVVMSLAPADAANIGFFEGATMIVRYHRGYPDEMQQNLKSRRVSLSYPNLTQIIHNRRPYYINDISRSEDWRVVDSSDKIQAWLGIPIMLNGAIIGLVNLDSHTPNVYTRQHLRRMMAIANHISTMIEMVQLYDTITDYGNVLAAITRQNMFLFASLNESRTLDELCTRIAETVVNVFGTTDCGVMLLNEAGDELVRYARVGEFQVGANNRVYMDGKGLVVQAVRNNQRIYAPDVRANPHYAPNEPRTRSELVVPLRSLSGVIGVLDLQSPHIHPFSPREIEALEAFSIHAAAMIENLRRDNQQRDTARELEARIVERTQELAHTRDRLQAILDNTAEPTVLVDSKGLIEQANPALVQLVGRDTESLIDKPFDLLFFERHRETLKKFISNSYANRLPHHFELLLDTKAGRGLSNVELTIAPVVLPDSEEISLVCTMRDVTHYKQAQQNLERTLEAERELSQMRSLFIQTVSHEFRTPLAVILSSSEILRHYGEKLDASRKDGHFQKIMGQVRHIETLLDDVLFMSRIESNEVNVSIARVDLWHLIDKAITMQAELVNSHRLIKHKQGDHSTVLKGDEQMLLTLLSHLISNAVKYSPDADKVDITLDVMQPDLIVLSVQDYGIGIPDDDVPRLFQPFYRASNAGTVQGTGLGLSIIQHIAEQHRAVLKVDSVVGAGTRISVHFRREHPYEELMS